MVADVPNEVELERMLSGYPLQYATGLKAGWASRLHK